MGEITEEPREGIWEKCGQEEKVREWRSKKGIKLNTLHCTILA
jgi:hypothetical protein